MNKNNSSKNKKILILHPYKFTEFKTYTYEIANLKKKYEVIIHDLSCVSSNKKYNKEWKTKKEKKSITFTSLYSWVREFNKIKKKENILVWDFLHYGSINFKVFIIQLILSFAKFPILKHGIVEVGCWTAEKKEKFKYVDKLDQLVAKESAKSKPMDIVKYINRMNSIYGNGKVDEYGNPETATDRIQDQARKKKIPVQVSGIKDSSLYKLLENPKVLGMELGHDTIMQVIELIKNSGIVKKPKKNLVAEKPKDTIDHIAIIEKNFS